MKKRFILRFLPEAVSVPITYTLIKEYDFKINILKAEIDAGKEGHLLIEVEADEKQIAAGLKYLEKEKVQVVPLREKITLQKDKCVNCGACLAVCFAGAIDINRTTWELSFTPDKCIACGFCVKACPLKLFAVDF